MSESDPVEPPTVAVTIDFPPDERGWPPQRRWQTFPSSLAEDLVAAVRERFDMTPDERESTRMLVRMNVPGYPSREFTYYRGLVHDHQGPGPGLAWDQSQPSPQPRGARSNPPAFGPTLEQHCETCGYWTRDGLVSDITVGWCRRFPPQVVEGLEIQRPQHGVTTTEFESVWPETAPTSWCGEWAAR